MKVFPLVSSSRDIGDWRALKQMILLPELEYFSPQIGGAVARCVGEMLAELPDIDAQIRCRRLPRTVKPYAAGHLSTYSFPKLPTKVVYRCLSAAAAYTTQTLDTSGSDLVEVHNRPQALRWVRRKYSGPLALHMHNEPDGRISPSRLQQMLSLSDVVIVKSAFLRDSLIERIGHDVTPIQIVPGGYRPTVQDNARAPELAGPFRLLFIGRIVEEKGLDVLIEAVGMLIAAEIPVQLSIIGTASFGLETKSAYVEKLEHQSAQVNATCPGAIRFLGHVPHGPLFQKYLTDSNVLIFPSRWNEPFGLVLLEAMGAGLPVIASRVGAAPEVVGEAGVLVDVNSPSSICEAVRALIESPTERLDLGARGRSRAQQFTWKRVAQLWQDALGEIAR